VTDPVGVAIVFALVLIALMWLAHEETRLP
jgi:hypothetical protein